MRPLGSKGEDLAVKYLKKRGFRIIKRNYKAPTGEIDIIAREGRTVVFIEVKTRTDDLFGLPVEAVGTKKQQRIKDTALYYLSGLRSQPPARFDIISVYIKNSSHEIDHLKDAFEPSRPPY